MASLIGQLEHVAYATYVGRVANFAFWALPAWDWVVSLDLEIDYIWSKPWGFGTFLYLWNRYVSGALLTAIVFVYVRTDLTPYECMAFFIYEGVAGTITLLIIKLIMTTRVYALWGSSKIILGILLFCLTGVIASMITIFTLHFISMGAITSIGAIKLNACVPIRVAPFFFSLWFAPMAYEALCFILALVKVYASVKDTLRKKGGRRNFVEIMFRDSLVYFLGVTLAELTIAVVWLVGPDTTMQAMVAFSWSIASVLCSRMMLNLRKTYYTRTGYTAEVELSAMPRFGKKANTATTVSTLFAGSTEKDEISLWNPTITLLDSEQENQQPSPPHSPVHVQLESPLETREKYLP